MKTKKRFLQKIRISILIAISLINIMFPIFISKNKTYAKTTGNNNTENYEKLKNAYETQNDSVYKGQNNEYGTVVYDNETQKYSFYYYLPNGEEHSIIYGRTGYSVAQSWLYLGETNNDDDSDIEIAKSFTNNKGKELGDSMKGMATGRFSNKY